MNYEKNKSINFPLPGSIINVQAFKYDGTLYRQWNGVKVLKNVESQYVLFIYKTKVSELYKKSWTYHEPVIWFMPKNEMFNALVLLKPKKNYVYVNLSSKPIYEDNTIKFIDFDFDVKNYPKNEFLIVDKEDFISNSKKYNYPKELVEMIFKSLERIGEKYNLQEYFYNQEVVDYYVDVAKKDKVLDASFRAVKHSYKKNKNSK